MQIDIRTYHEDEEITGITFGTGESLEVSDDEELFYVCAEGKRVAIYMDSIPNLKKALEKAEEIWG